MTEVDGTTGAIARPLWRTAMPRTKKVKETMVMDAQPARSIADVLYPDPTPKEEPKRTLRLLSWDKGIQAGMLHIGDNGKSAVYYVRRIGNVAKSFTFCKVQPTEHGLQISNPYSVNVYREKTGLSGVCHCDGYKHRKTCRHVDAAITMVEEYGV